MWVIKRLLQFAGWLAVFLAGYVLFAELTERLIEHGREISADKP